MNANDHPRGDILQAYFDAELPAAEAAVVTDHCRDCSDCRAILADLAVVQGRLAADAAELRTDSVWPDVEARLQRERNRRFGPALAFGTAFACAAGVVLGILVGEPAGDGLVDRESDIWTASDYFSSGSPSSSLLDVYSTAYATERSGE